MTRVFSSDPQKSQDRSKALQNYFREHVLSGTNFICQHEKACKASHRSDFYEGQLHHVGANYDLREGDQPFRVVVCGQEYGRGPNHVDMDKRYRDIVDGSGLNSRFFSTPGYEPRNPHMRGTTSVLRLLFGLSLGSDHADEYIAVNGSPVHIFDAFALVNYLLCSATDGNRIGKSTRTMQRNCAGHFRTAINILQPTILVCQGIGVRNWLANAFAVDSIQCGLERIKTDVLDTLVLDLTHPSSRSPTNWGWNDHTDYLLNTVQALVGEALRISTR